MRLVVIAFATLLAIVFVEIHNANSIPDYKAMIKLNNIPVEMDRATMLLCSNPSVIYGPHDKGMITYYENTVAHSKTDKDLKFKIGSVITKEKIIVKGNAIVPEVVTVMEKKRNIGNIDDWKFSIYSLKSNENITDKFNKTSNTSCIACHKAYSMNDYVSSEYFKIKSIAPK